MLLALGPQAQNRTIGRSLAGGSSAVAELWPVAPDHSGTPEEGGVYKELIFLAPFLPENTVLRIVMLVWAVPVEHGPGQV
jgi:hypothetical protein